MKMTDKIKITIAFLVALVFVSDNSTLIANAVSNGTGVSLAPMNQSIVLTPGDVYYGSFKIVAPNFNEDSIEYEIEQRSFYVDDQYDTIYDEIDSPIVKWTTIETPTSGIINPNNNVSVNFKIEVPRDAAAGGQYEAFRVTTKAVDADTNRSNNSAAIEEQLIITHLLFVEVTGDTIRQGEISEIDVPGFVLSGNISGASAIKNTGNVHGKAKYILRVFPLFSDEEIYTNAEDPEYRTILPDRTFYNRLSWPDSPAIGIFNVVYTVEFEGVTQQVSKMVIKSPIWLLFIIIFAIAAIIIYFVARAKARKSPRKAETE